MREADKWNASLSLGVEEEVGLSNPGGMKWRQLSLKHQGKEDSLVATLGG